MSEQKLVKLTKVPVIASDEGAKQSLDLFELTLEIASAKNASQWQKYAKIKNFRSSAKYNEIAFIIHITVSVLYFYSITDNFFILILQKNLAKNMADLQFH